jgi:regulatory protein
VSAGTVPTLDRALALAYRYVGRRERTESEVREHLAGREIPGELVEAAVAELRELGVLDDARFARLLVEDKRTLDGWGAERIARVLRQRGIDRELAEAALAPYGYAEELDAAMALLRRRFPAPPQGPRERERALGLLVRRGYDSELALDAIRRHGRDEDGEARR